MCGYVLLSFHTGIHNLRLA